MKAILIDTNIVLDIALERRDFYEKAKELIGFFIKACGYPNIKENSIYPALFVF